MAGLLRLSGVRTWWLLAGALLLTWGMLQVPQGREFFEPTLPLSQLVAQFVAAMLVCLLIGTIAAWLVSPHAAGEPTPAPVAAWFAAGIAALLVSGGVAIVQQDLAPAAISARVVLCAGVLSAWFTAHFGVWQDRPVRRARATALLWCCWVALLATVLWPGAAWATVWACGWLLAGHVVMAHEAPDAYRAGDAAAGGAAGRLVLAPAGSLLAVAAGYNNAIDPVVSLGNAVGPVATLTLAMGFWLGACFLVVWLGALLTSASRWLARGRWPTARWQTVGTVCVGLAAASLLHALGTGHLAAAPVRQMDVPADPLWQPAPPGPAEPTESWLRRRLQQLALRAPSGAPIPLLFVAAEGGGVRAAYWTASVLAGLDERYAGFGPSLVALSGVSGGSVGASIYQGVATSGWRPDGCGLPECPKTRRHAVQAILGDDFLSPALMALLVGEPLRDLGLSSRAMDRAAALERGLEARFQAITGSTWLQQPACAPQPPAGALLLPGLTDANSGKRIVLSCLPRASASADITEPLWLDAAPTLRASTAALLSARFPLVSPTGLLTHQARAYRIVDGGYSDNTGTGTVVDLLQMVHAAARELGLDERIRPVVLVLSNAASPDPAATRGVLGGGVLGIVADPLATLDAVRARNAADYRRWIDSVAGQPQSRATLVEWRLPHKPGAGYPLGWLLGHETSRAMATDVQASLSGPGSKALEAATGWHVRACDAKGGPAPVDPATGAPCPRGSGEPR